MITLLYRHCVVPEVLSVVEKLKEWQKPVECSVSICFAVSVVLHSSLVVFPFSGKLEWLFFFKSQKELLFSKDFHLEEAVFDLRRPWRSQQGVSLTGVLQPFLLCPPVSRVLRHGVGLLLQCQRTESRTAKHMFTLCTHSNTYSASHGHFTNVSLWQWASTSF